MAEASEPSKDSRATVVRMVADDFITMPVGFSVLLNAAKSSKLKE